MAPTSEIAPERNVDRLWTVRGYRGAPSSTNAG
jgi:hypothetical protein